MLLSVPVRNYTWPRALGLLAGDADGCSLMSSIALLPLLLVRSYTMAAGCEPLAVLQKVALALDVLPG